MTKPHFLQTWCVTDVPCGIESSNGYVISNRQIDILGMKIRVPHTHPNTHKKLNKKKREGGFHEVVVNPTGQSYVTFGSSSTNRHFEQTRTEELVILLLCANFMFHSKTN